MKIGFNVKKENCVVGLGDVLVTTCGELLMVIEDDYSDIRFLKLSNNEIQGDEYSNLSCLQNDLNSGEEICDYKIKEVISANRLTLSLE